jgi:hypothetical protein
MPSLRRAAVPLAVVLPAVFAAPAGAMIVPQDNIQGVKIGMTQQKVLDTLGDPAKTITRLGGGGGETPITTYSYLKRGMRVRFIPNQANTANVAFAVEVYADRGQRTAEGIGIGSTRRAVRTKIKGAWCRRYDPSYAFCLVGSGKAHRKSTTFLLNRKNRVKTIFIAKPFDE